jgi:predicted CxxxxCH...CXXCH cytochrome family protein
VSLFWTIVACLQPGPPAAPGCADCHGSGTNPAPPEALGGVTDPFARGVGAHDTHVTGTDGAAPVECRECHLVPVAVDSEGHVDTEVPAEVGWANGDIAKEDDAGPYDFATGSCTVYCHGVGLAGAAKPTVVWTELGSVGCGDCHGNPPPTPVHAAGGSCSDCHGGGVSNPERHVDGRLDVLGATPPESGDHTGGITGGSCAEGCHGTAETPAPPPDNAGNTEPSAVGVGAHAAHLGGGNGSVPVACTTCHVVPGGVGDAGHLDDVPADDTFSGLAAIGGRSPSWNLGPATCSDTYCHDQGGDTPAPVWTDEGITCSACHGNPPPPPHPGGSGCASCHPHAGDDAALHVDGVLQR